MDMTTATALPPLAAKPQRLLSLDAFRGLTIASMILVNNPGSWGAIYAPLEHAEWHGCTPTDLIFPFFLFIVGVATPFSFATRRAKGGTTADLLTGVVFRAISIVMLGMLLLSTARALPKPIMPDGLLGMMNIMALGFVPAAFVLLLWPWKREWVGHIVTLAVVVCWLGIYLGISYLPQPQDYLAGSGLTNPNAMRWPGVLQRIGVVYLFAGMIALLPWQAILCITIALCAGYTTAMMSYGPIEKTENLARMIDVYVFGKHAYGAYPDPEGLLSTFTALATCLCGVLAGKWLRTDKPITDRAAGLLAAGVIVSVIGIFVGWWTIPANKQIWTASFVLLTAGLACLCFGACFYVIDVKQKRSWCLPLVAFGMNPITMFLLAGITSRTMALITVPRSWLPPAAPWVKVPTTAATDPIGIQSVFTQWAGHLQRLLTPEVAHTPEAASLAYAVCFVLVFTILALAMYRAKIFLKV